MKILRNLGLIIVAAALLTACGSSQKQIDGNGKLTSQTRTLKDFSAIDVSGSYVVDVVTNSSSPSITINGDENLLPYIKTEVSGSTLTIKTADNIVINPSKRFSLTVNTKDLQSLSTTGAISANIGQAVSQNFSIKAFGTVDLTARITAEKLSVDTSGTTQLTLAGKTNILNIHSSGTGNIGARNLLSDTTVINSNGAGTIIVNAANSLQITVNGSTAVNYYGTPKIQQSIRGSAQVKNAPKSESESTESAPTPTKDVEKK